MRFLIDRSEAVGIEREFVIQNVAGAFSGQIEITVLAQIDGRGLVGGGFVVDDQFVGVGQSVGDFERQISGKAVVTIFAEVGVGHASLAFEGLAIPDNFIERLLRAAVESVGPVVLGQGIGLAVESESAVGNAVGVASDDGANVRRIRNIAVERFMAEDDVSELAFAVGDANRKNDAAIIHRVDFNTVCVG